MSTITKPFLKWVGGKTQSIDTILSLFPSKIKNYHEPFVGGGSVLLGVLSHIQNGTIQVSGTIYASDLNSNLIHLYTNIQQHPNRFIQEIQNIVEQYNSIHGTVVNRKAKNIDEALTSKESYYYWIRNTFNSLTKEQLITPKASAMMLFMNKTCFRGMYREGPNGFNVPFGNYKKPTIFQKEHIKYVSELIKDVIFTPCSYTDSLSSVATGDFVYLDPPYAPETKTSFVSYTKQGFTIEDHTSLFKLCNTMNQNKIQFLMSNADVTLVKEAFPNHMYTIKSISCRRAINSKKPGSKTTEVLILN